MMDTTAVDRLIQIGRQRGGVEIDDIRKVLPIDAMSVEEISDALALLEEAGISVEIDPAMLTARSRRLTLPDVTPPTESLGQSLRTTTSQDRASVRTRSIKSATENSSLTHVSANPHVQKSATIIILATALILVLIAMGVWHFA